MYKLYKIVNILNGHTYISMTNQELDKRFYQHKTNKKKTKLSCAFKRYGTDKFRISLIYTYSTKEECCLAEIERIKIDGYYNIAKGGTGGFVIVGEAALIQWKARLKISRVGKTPAKNMKHSIENKKLFSDVSRKYWNTQSTYDWSQIRNLNHREAKKLYGISTTHYYRLKGQYK